MVVLAEWVPLGEFIRALPKNLVPNGAQTVPDWPCGAGLRVDNTPKAIRGQAKLWCENRMFPHQNLRVLARQPKPLFQKPTLAQLPVAIPWRSGGRTCRPVHWPGYWRRSSRTCWLTCWPLPSDCGQTEQRALGCLQSASQRQRLTLHEFLGVSCPPAHLGGRSSSLQPGVTHQPSRAERRTSRAGGGSHGATLGGPMPRQFEPHPRPGCPRRY